MIYTRTVTSTLALDQTIIGNRIIGYRVDCRTNWARWIFASATKYFNQMAEYHGLHFYIEGTHRETNQEEEYIEFRMDGPDIIELCNNYFRLDVEINILWSFIQNHTSFHRIEAIKGVIMDAMKNICIYKYGDGVDDDDTVLGVLKLKQIPTRVNNFGQVRPDVKLMQGTVESSYEMLLHC